MEAMKKFNNQEAGLHPEGANPTPDGVEKGLIDILEIIADALYREDIITTGEMNFIERTLRRLKIRVIGSTNTSKEAEYVEE